MTTAGKIALAAGVGTAAVAIAYVLTRRRATTSAGLGREGRALQPIDEGQKGNRWFQEYSDAGMTIRDKIGLLQDRVAASVKDPAMRKLALQVTRHCESRDDQCEAEAIHDWVKKNIRYTGDIAEHRLSDGSVESVDLFQSAQATADFGGGDCDDHVVLNATLAILNGIPAQIRVTSPSSFGKDYYSHVYALLGLPKNAPKKWLAADTTLPGSTKFGDEWGFKRKIDSVA